MNPSIQSSFCFVYITLHLGVFLETFLAFCRFEHTYVPNNVVFNRQRIYLKLLITFKVFDVSFITWLTTPLWMEDSFVKYHYEVLYRRLNQAFRGRKNIQNLTSALKRYSTCYKM